MSGLISMNVDGSVRNRALAAYFRSAGAGAPQPSENIDGWTIKGKSYVVLQHESGMMAVYRIKTDGFLKRLKRIPKDIVNQYQ